MNSLYTDEIRGFLLSVKWPKGLIVDTVEYADHISLRLYRLNFNKFDGTDKKEIAKIVGETINALRKTGCPSYLEVLPGNGID